jgi:hypothetical protein
MAYISAKTCPKLFKLVPALNSLQNRTKKSKILDRVRIFLDANSRFEQKWKDFRNSSFYQDELEDERYRLSEFSEIKSSVIY